MADQQDLLSQEEIDALLESVSAGELEDSGSREETPGVRPYDLSSQQRIVRGRLSGLEVVNQRFARLTRMNLHRLLQRDVEVTATAITDLQYGEYLHSLYVPTSLNLIRVHPMQDTALIVLDARLVFRLVDHFFGGNGQNPKVEGRDFTPAELRVVDIFLHRLFSDLTEAWRPVANLSCEFVGNEVNPAMATIVGLGETVVVSSFQVDVDGRGGQLQVVFPRSAFEPLRDALEASVHRAHSETDQRWTSTLLNQVMDADIELRCTVAELETSLGDISRWQAGDVIPIDSRSASTVTANGIPVFRAKLGVSHGNMALKILTDDRVASAVDDDLQGE